VRKVECETLESNQKRNWILDAAGGQLVSREGCGAAHNAHGCQVASELGAKHTSKMNKKLFVIPSAALSTTFLVAVLLIVFWDMQESKLYIVELALPILIFIALFYVVIFKSLGESQQAKETPLLSMVFSSATLVVGIMSIVIYAALLFTAAPPLLALGGVAMGIFLPIWTGYIVGGVLQMYLMKT